MSLLNTTDRGAVRWITLDRPERKNAIPPDGWAELNDAFHDFDESGQRVFVVTGSGGDFCSGADLAEDDVDAIAGVAANAARMRLLGEAALALHRLPKPTIAAVDGVAAGAGMNLAIGCDLVIATERARFSEIFARRGLSLDFGGTWLLPRLVGRGRAMEIALTGRMVEAEEALAIGLVTRVVPVGELEQTVTETAEDLAAGAPLAQRFIKTGLDRSDVMTFEQAIDYETQAQAVLLASRDAREAFTAFRDKRSASFEGR